MPVATELTVEEIDTEIRICRYNIDLINSFSRATSDYETLARIDDIGEFSRRIRELEREKEDLLANTH